MNGIQAVRLGDPEVGQVPVRRRRLPGGSVVAGAGGLVGLG